MGNFFYLIFTILILAACNTAPVGGNGVMEIRYNEIRQEIDGFGGSDAWTSLPQNAAADEVVKLLYSKTDGAGFTILRNRIPFRERLSGDNDPGLNDGFVVRTGGNTYDCTESSGIKTFNLNWNSWDIAGTKNLIARINNLGVSGPENLTMMSTPWTPPNNRITRWKPNVTDWSRPDVGGRLDPARYNDYADLLADYVRNFEAQMGVSLAILSLQNEPSFKCDYESADYSGADIRDFLKVIGQRFPQKGVALGIGGLGIMAPEYENFDIDFNDVIQPSLDDTAASGVLSHVALHQYNGGWDSSEKAGAKAFPAIAAAGKRFWQTEISGSGPRVPAGTGIDNALYFARMIHFDMTLAETNAFLYWWLWINSADENFSGSLIKVNGSKVTPALRLYAMGQYSRFIRPGWRRLAATSLPAGGVYSSAYRNPHTDEIAVVLINDTGTKAEITLNIQEAEFVSLGIWRTSAVEKLTAIGAQSISGGTTDITLPPKSISTFYGRVK